MASNATVTPITKQRPKRTTKKAAEAKPAAPAEVEAAEPEAPAEIGGVETTLNECPLNPGMLAFYEGDPMPAMLDEALKIVSQENQLKLDAGGFHDGLVFRAGKDSNQLITLIKDDEGVVRVEPLSGGAISVVLARRFCYIDPTKTKPYRHKQLPGWFSQALSGERRYQFPVLNGLVQHPAVHLDGSFVFREGYDRVTKSWVVTGWEDLQVPAAPSASQVLDAVSLLREPFAEVIFRGDEIQGSAPVKKEGVDMTPSEANVLGMFLTSLMRRQMGDAPFFVITANQPGTAKGLIASVVSWITQGDKPLVSALQSGVDMAEKQIGRVLEDHPGAVFLQFDEPDENPNGGFYSRLLALIATSGGSMVLRNVYGRKAVLLDTKRIIAFTGNNVKPDRDMVRRVSLIELDVPRDGTMPQERTFRFPERSNKVLLLSWAAARRREFVAAGLTLVAAWKAAGCPQADFEFDFPEWVHSVGGILQNAGVGVWMGNRNEVYADAAEAQVGSFLLALVDVVGLETNYTSRELAAKLVAFGDWARVKDMLTWNDPWATKLYQAWGDQDQMAYNLSRLLGRVKNRLLTDGASGRVVVANLPSHNNQARWQFTLPG